MIKVIDDRYKAENKDYLVFKVYQNPGDDTIYGYLIPHSEYDSEDHLNFVQTERDMPVAEAFQEAVRLATEFGADFNIDYMWIQDLDELFPPKDRPELTPRTPDTLREAS